MKGEVENHESLASYYFSLIPHYIPSEAESPTNLTLISVVELRSAGRDLP
jgi:hypothetical protein